MRPVELLVWSIPGVCLQAGRLRLRRRAVARLQRR